jgi:hypothetical protein
MANNDLKKWKDRRTVAAKKFSPMVDNIKKWRNYYRGNQWPHQWGGEDTATAYRDKTVDNLVYANIKAIMPSINFNNPKIFVEARRKPFRQGEQIFDTEASATIFETVINYYLQELQVKKEVDKCLLDALLGPWGVMQLGYTAETEKINNGEVLEVNELIKADSPFATRISPLDFLVDVEAKDSHLNDAGWCGVKWTKTLDEVKKDPRYENTKTLKPNAQVKTEYPSNVKSPSDKTLENSSDFERVEGWDIWSIKDRRLITIVDSHDKFLRNENGWPLEFDGYPFETLFFNENPDELMPVSDVDIYLSAQDELNRFRSLQLSHAKRVSQRKYIAQASAFDPEELDKLENGPDGTVLKSNGSVDTAIRAMQDAGTSQDIYIAINQLKQSIGESSSVAAFEKGIAQKFDTATEPALIAQGTTIKRAERLQTLEDFYVRIAKKTGKILQQTLDPISIPLDERQFQTIRQQAETKLEKIAGPENAIIMLPWLNTKKEDIDGDFDFRMDVGSTEPINQEKRKQDAITLGQLSQGNPYVRGGEGTRRLFEAFKEPNLDALLKTDEEVAEEQSAAAEAATQAAVATDMPKRQVDLEKTRMKTETQLQTTLIKALTESDKTGTLEEIARLNRSKSE